MQLSEHFSLQEFTVSQKAARRGPDNAPPPDVLPALRRTAEGLERPRETVLTIDRSGTRPGIVEA
jgi:hypothetical protein